MKRIFFSLFLALFLVATFALLSPSALAVEEASVSIVWNEYRLSFDTTGCSTWEDLANTGDAGFVGLYVSSKGNVCFQPRLSDDYFLVCDSKGNIQKGDDVITDKVYSFWAIRLSFGDDFEYLIQCDHTSSFGTAWFDLARDPLDDYEYYVMTESDGNMSFVVSGVGTFGIYDTAGRRQNENDPVDATNYILMCDYTFSIEGYDDDGPTGEIHKLSGLISDFSLSYLVSSETVFTSDTLGKCIFAYSSKDHAASLLVGVDESGAFQKRYYLFDGEALIRDLSSACYYSDDPCRFGFHSYFDSLQRVEATCKEAGFVRYQCGMCTSLKDEILPAREHRFDRYTVVVAPTCTETGIEARICRDCDDLGYKHTMKALGHDRNIFGACTREGCGEDPVGSLIGGIGDAIGGLFPDKDSSGEDSSGDGSSGNWFKDLFIGKDTGDPNLNFLNGIIRLIGVVLIAALFFMLWKPLKAFFHWLVDVFKGIGKAISSGAKSLSKRLKAKKKNKKKDKMD